MRTIPYKDWEDEFPGYVIIKKEGYFYSAHNASAAALNQYLGYKIFIDPFGRETTGGPSLEKIEAALEHHGIRYVVIEGDTIISKFGSGRTFKHTSVQKPSPKSITPTREGEVHAGSIVVIMDCSTSEELSLIVCDVTEIAKYKHSGGSYYGAGTELIRSSDAGKMIDDSFVVSIDSPLGKALLGHVKDDRVSVNLPNGDTDEYLILAVQ